MGEEVKGRCRQGWLRQQHGIPVQNTGITIRYRYAYRYDFLYRYTPLRTGHHHLDYPLYPTLSIGHTQQCPCGTGSQTTEHLLQSCPLRKGIWPDHTPVAQKLYSSLEDLRHTATFTEETGVSIWRLRRICHCKLMEDAQLQTHTTHWQIKMGFTHTTHWQIKMGFTHTTHWQIKMGFTHTTHWQIKMGFTHTTHWQITMGFAHTTHWQIKMGFAHTTHWQIKMGFAHTTHWQIKMGLPHTHHTQTDKDGVTSHTTYWQIKVELPHTPRTDR